MRRQNARRATIDIPTEILSAGLRFLAVNLLWIFFALWLLYGMGPVLLLAMVMNHLINRLETQLLQEARGELTQQ